MSQSEWDEKLIPLQALIMKPVRFNNIQFTLMDAVNAYHEPGWKVEVHRHPWFEFSFVSHGCFCTTIEGIEFAAKENSFFLMPPGVFHSNRNNGDGSDDGFCLRWQIENSETLETKGSEMKQFAAIMNTLSVPRPYSMDGKAIEAFLKHLGTTKSITSTQIYLMQLLALLYECWNGEGEELINGCSREEAIVRQAILYLSEYASGNLEVNDLANSLNVSYRHLARIFKKVTGVTIVEKLNDIRLNNAKKLLIHTDKTIHEIAQLIGYQNEYYFSSIFSAHAFSTPSEFRRKFKNLR